MLRNALAIFVSTLALSLCSGCTLVGLGIGAAIPKKTTYGEESPAGPALARAVEDERLEAGDHVVVTVSPPPARLDDAPISPTEEVPDIGPPPPGMPAKVEGDFRSLKRGLLALDSEDYYAQVPLDRVETARVSHGSYWLGGMLFGLAVDGAIGSIAIAIVSSIGHIK